MEGPALSATCIHYCSQVYFLCPIIFTIKQSILFRLLFEYTFIHSLAGTLLFFGYCKQVAGTIIMI